MIYLIIFMGENGTVVPLKPIKLVLNYWPLRWLIDNSLELTVVVFLPLLFYTRPNPRNVRRRVRDLIE